MPIRLLLTFLGLCCNPPCTTEIAAETFMSAARDFLPAQSSAATADAYTEPPENSVALPGLAIDTSQYFDAPAAAYLNYRGKPGTFRLEILAIAEEDGESLYEIFVNGQSVGQRRTPSSDRKRTPVWLDFGTATIQPGNRIEVLFRGHTNLKIPEGEGFAWSRGRWRGLRITPTEAPPPSRDASIQLKHVPLWTGIRHPVDDLASDIFVFNPYGEPIRPQQLSPRSGERSIAFVVDVLGQWIVKAGDKSFTYQVDPGKYLGPLSIWSRNSQTLATSNDRPLRLYWQNCSLPRKLLESTSTQKAYINAVHHSPINLIKFTEPLINQLTSESASPLENLEKELDKVEAMLDAFGEKSIYLWLSQPIIADSVVEALSSGETTFIHKRIREIILLRWNVWIPELAPTFTKPELERLPTGTRRLFESTSVFEANSNQVFLLDGMLSKENRGFNLPMVSRNSLPQQGIDPQENALGSQAIWIGNGSYPDIDFDSNGSAHIVYSRNGSLYYRSFESNTKILSPETDTTIRFKEKGDSPHRSDPEVAIDPEGNIHILAGTHYVIGDGRNWTKIETNFRRDTALAIDSQGNLFVCKRGGNHGGMIGIDILRSGTRRLQATENDPDIGTIFGHTWSLGKLHPYGSVFVDPQDTLYVVYRQGAPDYIAWRSSPDKGTTWHGGGVYGGDVWQSEAPSGIADDAGNIFVIGPQGWLFVKRSTHEQFQSIGHAINCWGRDLPELGIVTDERIAIASFGGRIAFLENGGLSPETRIIPPDRKPVGFVNLAAEKKSKKAFAILESGTEVENDKIAGTSNIWLVEL